MKSSALSFCLLLAALLVPCSGSGKNLRLGAIADFRLVKSSLNGGRSRFGTNEDKHFDLGRLALSASGAVREGVKFYSHLDFQSTVNGGANLTVNEAYMKFNPFVGRLSGKFGAYALPFSIAYGEPMRTTTWTITPSALDTFFEGLRITGFEVSKGYDVPGHHFNWAFGTGYGNDGASLFNRQFNFSEAPGNVNGLEGDGHLAAYGYIGKFRSNACKRGRLSWHTGFFWNGGDGDNSLRAADETKFLLFDCQFWKPYWGIAIQGMLGSSRRADVLQEADVSYVMAWGRINRKVSGILRYDHWNLATEAGTTVDRGHGLTVALSRQISKEQLLQVEWLKPSVSVGLGPKTSVQWQIRYRLHF